MRNISSDERREIEGLLGRELDELYMLVAQTDPSYGDVVFAPGEALERGKRSISRLTEPLYQKICEEWRYCDRRHDPDLSDSVTVVVAVSDLIITLVGGIPAATIAVLLVKKGLTALCECGSR